MMSLETFQTKLEALIGNSSFHRPFLCEGSPLECKIVIIADEPVTTLKHNFWEFWEPGYGFKKHLWFEAYRKERIQAGDTEETRTRTRINLIVEAAKPVKCLDTNINAVPDKNKEMIDFLTQAIEPRVIVVVNALPRIEVKELLKVTLPEPGERQRRAGPEPVQCEWGMVQMLSIAYFPRWWSEKSASDLGQELAALATS